MSNAAFKTPQRLAGYDDDFFAWTQEQAKLLRERRFGDLDLENIAEELETLGRRDKREICSRLQVLMMHLLKWLVQEEVRSSSWRATIREQRRQLNVLFTDSPSLRTWPAAIYVAEYPGACAQAARETGLPLERFPENCPFDIDQILNPEYLPA